MCSASQRSICIGLKPSRLTVPRTIEPMVATRPVPITLCLQSNRKKTQTLDKTIWRHSSSQFRVSFNSRTEKRRRLSRTGYTTCLQLRRVNDAFLMEIFLHHGFAKFQLWQLNQCRIFLRVSTVSDITSGNGHYVLPHFLSVENPHNPMAESNSLKWPEQGNPSSAAWILWRKAIKGCICIEKQYRLRSILGPCIQRSNSSKWSQKFRPKYFFPRHNVSTNSL